MMFEDFRTVPPLIAMPWTAVMFWVSLAWSVYALVANLNIKTAEALATDLGDLDELPASRRNKIKKLCLNRLWRPFYLWLKGLVMILFLLHLRRWKHYKSPILKKTLSINQQG